MRAGLGGLIVAVATSCASVEWGELPEGVPSVWVGLTVRRGPVAIVLARDAGTAASLHAAVDEIAASIAAATGARPPLGAVIESTEASRHEYRVASDDSGASLRAARLHAEAVGAATSFVGEASTEVGAFGVARRRAELPDRLRDRIAWVAVVPPELDPGSRLRLLEVVFDATPGTFGRAAFAECAAVLELDDGESVLFPPAGQPASAELDAFQRSGIRLPTKAAPGLAVSGPPSADLFEELAALGWSTVVDLRARPGAGVAGLRRVAMPVSTERELTREHADQLANALRAGLVLVCADDREHGAALAAMWAYYAAGISVEAAIEVGRYYGLRRLESRVRTRFAGR